MINSKFVLDVVIFYFNIQNLINKEVVVKVCFYSVPNILTMYNCILQMEELHFKLVFFDIFWKICFKVSCSFYIFHD